MVGIGIGNKRKLKLKKDISTEIVFFLHDLQYTYIDKIIYCSIIISVLCREKSF